MNLFTYKLNSMFTQKSLKGGTKNYLPTELSKHPDPSGQGAFSELQHRLLRLVSRLFIRPYLSLQCLT